MSRTNELPRQRPLETCRGVLCFCSFFKMVGLIWSRWMGCKFWDDSTSKKQPVRSVIFGEGARVATLFFDPPCIFVGLFTGRAESRTDSEKHVLIEWKLLLYIENDDPFFFFFENGVNLRLIGITVGESITNVFLFEMESIWGFEIFALLDVCDQQKYVWGQES